MNTPPTTLKAVALGGGHGLAVTLTALRLVGAGYRREGKRYLTVAVGCTGGKHRSVAISEEIARRLSDSSGMTVSVAHRDLGRE